MKIESFVDPYLNRTWRELGARVLTSGNNVVATLGYPAATYEKALAEQLAAHVGTTGLSVEARFAPPQGRGFGQVKHVIAVASGKGGVGKSTTAVNLALALDREGAKVGICDADIYGPSQGLMLGVADGTRPTVKDGKFFEPIKAHGLQAMSMSFMVTESTPMVWRGPMASGALQQLLTQTLWHDLDYLIVDMPPGTGDIQLTLSQRVPVSGAVIVTTPQDIALIDAAKGIEMFRKVDIPVLGIVENMSHYICPKCGDKAYLFGTGGGQRIADRFGVPLLGSLPLDLKIREQADGGEPTVRSDPDGAIAASYGDLARRTAAQLWGRESAAPSITMSDD